MLTNFPQKGLSTSGFRIASEDKRCSHLAVILATAFQATCLCLQTFQQRLVLQLCIVLPPFLVVAEDVKSLREATVLQPSAGGRLLGLH